MTSENVPNWKFWHPISIWKVLGIFLLLGIVFQTGFALLFVALGLSGGTGASLGAGLAGGTGAIIVARMAKKAREADTPENEPPAKS